MASSGQVRELTYVDMDTFISPLIHQFLLVASVLLLKNKIPILSFILYRMKDEEDVP